MDARLRGNDGRECVAKYVVLIRGINVGGKNKVPMKALKDCLEELGYSDIETYIASGNVVLTSGKGAGAIQTAIEKALPKAFKLDSELLKVLVLSAANFKAAVSSKPRGFGDQPGKYHSDAIFLMGLTAAEAMRAFDPKEGVDSVWPGKGVIYHQRLSAERTKTRLNKVMGHPVYKSMTIRNWATTMKLLEMLG